MDLKRIAKDTTKTLTSYLTYQAVRVVISQLDETEPKRAYWLHQFSAREKIQDGEAYLQALFQERQDLAFRILTVREHLANEIAEFLPEMLRSTVQQANMEQRRRQLERITQFGSTAPSSSIESSEASDSEEANDDSP
uniref:RuBisCO chaperone RbcX n=1 Tax=Phormidesmis sp. WJT36-NPBG15 TaxID=1601959 RepID=A0A2R4QLT5_9CYAN|nr:chaperonin-like protein component RbcX [Phormidesmis sp. WJT36-NPBG15]